MARYGYARWAAYPAATLAGMFTNVVFGFMRSYVLLALFAQREHIGAYDATRALTYVWLTQGLLMTVFIWGWNDLAMRIRTGDIAVDLVRPIHPLRMTLAADYGRALYHGAFRGIPPFIVGALFFPLVMPGDALTWLVFAVSIVLAIATSVGYRLVYNAAAFWLMDSRGPALAAGLLATLFSGFLVPVAFFPDWLARVAHATPFPSMIQTPVDIFVGAVVGADVLAALLVQLAWAVVMLATAAGVIALGTRRLVIQGG
ncbi:MAG: hypothetical protein AUH85_16210 [Chloroflexi bacterium 13_1_40CM_4_68_4]|nr:MAG: hypothetical protein AUH85_16210 [Chloroflexi bacterium 13_1_40CM_4_68_4]